MNFEFTEEQTMIKDSVSRFVRDEYDFDTRRAIVDSDAVSYTHLRAHETVLDLVCRLLLEKKN